MAIGFMGMWWGNIMGIRYLYRGKSLIGIFISWTILDTLQHLKMSGLDTVYQHAENESYKSQSWDGNDMFEAGKISLVL